MAKSLETIPQMNPMFWKKLGDEISDKIRVHTTDGKDIDSRSFKSYSKGYAQAKSQGKFKRQSSTSSKPDLQLTGDMMRNLQVRGVTPYGVTIGWSGTNAEKVQWNADMGRTVTSNSKPLSDKVWKFAEKELSKQMDKNLKLVAETTTITIG
jgi:hypothetical protein